MCISWWLLNISHLKMRGKYNVQFAQLSLLQMPQFCFVHINWFCFCVFMFFLCMGYIVLLNLEVTVYEFVVLVSHLSCYAGWGVSLSGWWHEWIHIPCLSAVWEERNWNPLVNWLVQYGTKARLSLFCCKDLYVVFVLYSFMFMCIFYSNLLCFLSEQ
jgi:hypothetical protein